MRYSDIERELRDRGEWCLADQLRREVDLSHDVTRFDVRNEIFDSELRREAENILIDRGEP